MELDDKKQFLSQCPPFSALDNVGLDQCLKQLSISYEKAGTELIREGDSASSVHLIRSGSVELRDSENQFLDRLSSGDLYGLPSGLFFSKAIVLEDSLIFSLPHSLIDRLSTDNDTFSLFFAGIRDKTLDISTDELDANVAHRDYRLNQRVSELMVKSPLCAGKDTSIREAAVQMSKAKVSSILLLDGNELCGIMTDRDLRSRVLAQGVDPQEPVSQVMTAQPKTIKATQTVYETQLTMMTANIHHLPVVEEGKPVGIITLNDFIRAQNSEPIYMIQAIHRASNREGLYQISKQLPELTCKLIRANVRADEIGRIITSITDSVTRQLITLARRSLGEEPCRYAWVVFGSQARQDQMLGSDQDNGLILEDGASPEAEEYFKSFAAFINEGLDKSGLKYCPGDVMAQNKKWRQTLEVWQQYFVRWIRQPDPKALMHASIFYDIRHVAGDRSLSESLRTLVLEEAQKNTIFQACMSQNALESSPPLGFFKTFVLEKDGNHNAVLDLKHRGTVPIVSLVRLYCLAKGIGEVNTSDRLKALEEANILSVSESSNLRDAHEFIARLRLDGQSDSMLHGEAATNLINPDELSPLLRHQLKSAFSVVAESQRLLKMRFGHGSL